VPTKTHRARANVFSDLGFSPEHAANLRIRAELMSRLTGILASRKLGQADAAELLGVTQPRISDLMRGKIDRFSIDTLIAMLGQAGAKVNVVVRGGRRVA
jgi:predicted XRE-type DNA-binding protein